jgi:hypothetical protein
MKDPQGSKVYRWEENWVDWRPGKRLSQAKVREWVRWACKLYGVKPPVVRFHPYDYGGTSFYDPNKHYIEFRGRHMNIWVALHEAAHAIVDNKVSMDLPAHGADWLGVFRVLLDKAMLRSIKQAGIKYKKQSVSKPKRLKRRRRQ